MVIMTRTKTNSTNIACNTAIILQVNEKSLDFKEGWYKKEGDKTGMNGCMLPW